MLLLNAGNLRSLALQTRQGWDIPNLMHEERTSAELQRAVAFWRQSRPGASLRSISSVYNCMGLVFGSRRTCIDPEDLPRLLADDCYRKITSLSEVQCGDVVVYHDRHGEPSHVGLVWERNLIIPGHQEEPFKVLSQWGADGEYIHDWRDVPVLLGVPVEIWTDRRSA